MSWSRKHHSLHDSVVKVLMCCCTSSSKCRYVAILLFSRWPCVIEIQLQRISHWLLRKQCQAWLLPCMCDIKQRSLEKRDVLLQKSIVAASGIVPLYCMHKPCEIHSYIHTYLLVRYWTVSLPLLFSAIHLSLTCPSTIQFVWYIKEWIPDWHKLQLDNNKLPASYCCTHCKKGCYFDKCISHQNCNCWHGCMGCYLWQPPMGNTVHAHME